MYKLKQKAKILVAESAVLIGVIDEEGVLEENEVFVQVKRDNYKVENKNGSGEKLESKSK